MKIDSLRMRSFRFIAFMKAWVFIAPGMLCILLATGCVNPMNELHGDRYLSWGMQHEKNGNLEQARKCYSKALWYYQTTTLGVLADKRSAREAYALYDLSRVVGYLGRFDQAESGFTNVLTLIERAKGHADDLRLPALCELARLYQDTRQDQKAVPVFSDAVAETERRLQLLPAKEMPDPGAFADLLDDYLESLARIGAEKEAEAMRAKTRSWRKEHPEPAKFKARRYAATSP